MVVIQKIEDVEHPERITGKAGEKFALIIKTRLEGDGANYQYIEFSIGGALVGEGVSDVPYSAPNTLTWTGEMEVTRDIPPGTEILFEVRVGHLEDGERVEDDLSSFTILVERGVVPREIPWWLIAAIGLAAVGLVWAAR